jgi:hypothetical protein
MTNNPYTEGLTDEQLERYNYLKDTILRLQPNIIKDRIQTELWEYLWRYFAINNALPDEKDKGEKEEIINDYKTPADIESTLNKEAVRDIPNVIETN